MNKHTNLVLLALVVGLSFLMTSCQAIGDIFKAGVWAGLIGVIVVVVIVVAIFRKLM